MKAVFTLTPAEGRRLIAKGIVQMPEVRAAWENGYIVLVGSTINGYIAQELLGLSIEPQRYTAGINTNRLLCVTDEDARDSIPIVVYKGKVVEKTVDDVYDDFHLESVVIKGANAFDETGDIGVITSGFNGGTIAATLGTITSTGMKYIFAVGLEKRVPSVKQAAASVGSKTFDYSMGATFGMFCLSNYPAVTEIEALRILAGVETTLIASGGVGGSEGAVVLVSTGSEAEVKKAIVLVESVKGEPAVSGNKGTCAVCPYPCTFQGKKEEELPSWLH